jgi:hypothetical protein
LSPGYGQQYNTFERSPQIKELNPFNIHLLTELFACQLAFVIFSTIVRHRLEDMGAGKYVIAEFVFTYCDRILKSAKSTEAEVEDSLEKVVQLFSYLAEKYVFADI